MTDNLKLTHVDLTVKCEVVATVANRMSDKFFILIEEEEEIYLHAMNELDKKKKKKKT